MALFPRISGAVKVFKVGRRIFDALFAKGGDMTLPAEPGPNGEVQEPSTISLPTGVLRDHANQSIIITVIFAIANVFGWDIFGWTEQEANTYYNAATILFGAVAGIFRTKSRVITRG